MPPTAYLPRVAEPIACFIVACSSYNLHATTPVIAADMNDIDGKNTASVLDDTVTSNNNTDAAPIIKIIHLSSGRWRVAPENISYLYNNFLL